MGGKGGGVVRDEDAHWISLAVRVHLVERSNNGGNRETVIGKAYDHLCKERKHLIMYTDVFYDVYLAFNPQTMAM